jgi:hypothetical protein
VRQLWQFFESQGQENKFSNFQQKIDAYVNDEDAHTRFAKMLFEVYDTLDQERITDEGLFRFMQ